MYHEALNQNLPLIAGALHCHATPDARPIVVSPYDVQGKSRDTFLVTSGPDHYILSVNKERSVVEKTLMRGDKVKIEAYKDHLRNSGLPVPRTIGSFLLPCGTSCDLAEFVHGCQYKTGFDLPQKELSELARTLAAMHNASAQYVADQPPGTHLLKDRLPSGFVHADYKANNVIYDPHTRCINAVLDFEVAHRNTFAYEVGRSIFKACTRFALTHEGVQLRFDRERAEHFLKEYDAVRPLTRGEAEEVSRSLMRNLCNRIRLENKKHPTLSDEALEGQIERIVPQISGFDATRLLNVRESAILQR